MFPSTLTAPFNDLLFVIPAAAAVILAFNALSSWRARLKAVKLRGPTTSSWMFGVSKDLQHGDSGILFENWATQYGPAFQVPGPFGSRRTVLFDAKAISYFFQKETFTFRQSNFSKKAIANIVSHATCYVPITLLKRLMINHLGWQRSPLC